jgi:hypothetical protein
MIPNLGSNRGFTHGAIRRIGFVLKSTTAGTDNFISIAHAADIANWQTKQNAWDHAADPSIRVAWTDIVYKATSTPGDPVVWEIEDFKEEMRAGTEDIAFSLLNPSPQYMSNLISLKSEVLGVYFMTEYTEVLGMKDGVNVKPFPLQFGSLSIPNYKTRGYSEGSENIVSFRLLSGTDKNRMISVVVADGDVTSNEDFYSLEPVTGTIGTPAVTGCTITVACDNYDPEDAATAIRVTGVTFGMITLIDQADDSETTLAAEGSLSYAAGVYTINESALLDAGHTYLPVIDMPRYQITCGLVVVPGGG